MGEFGCLRCVPPLGGFNLKNSPNRVAALSQRGAANFFKLKVLCASGKVRNFGF